MNRVVHKLQPTIPAIPQRMRGAAYARVSNDKESMVEALVAEGVTIKLCRTCALARGLAELTLIPGLSIGTLPELADWTLAADKVITF